MDGDVSRDGDSVTASDQHDGARQRPLPARLRRARGQAGGRRDLRFDRIRGRRAPAVRVRRRKRRIVRDSRIAAGRQLRVQIVQQRPDSLPPGRCRQPRRHKISARIARPIPLRKNRISNVPSRVDSARMAANESSAVIGFGPKSIMVLFGIGRAAKPLVHKGQASSAR